MTDEQLPPAQIIAALSDARARTLDLVADLSDAQMLGPQLKIVNPPLWEIGHVAWFQEKWALRHLRGLQPLRENGDTLYDSAEVAHDTRWDLLLPSRQGTLAYMQEVFDGFVERLGSGPLSEREAYFHLLPLFHEDMHDEALAYTRQTLGYPAPSVRSAEHGSMPLIRNPQSAIRNHPGDAEVPGGHFLLGAWPTPAFAFDNEKWAHPVEIHPFRIARTAVTNAEFAAFVDDGGYRSARWWSEAGWSWREAMAAEHPVYWQRESPGRWLRRRFDAYRALEPDLPVLHVSWYEAEAYCQWAGRRLPTEAEWEMAASAEPVAPGTAGELGWRKRRFPWGDELPTPERANLDMAAAGCLEVGALPAGDSYFGCRQMVGNVWEWTATDFGPYPGFVADPYQEYSEPWFGDHKVLRGGCWATRSRLIRTTWRNFYKPDRRDVWAGFRTCARDG